MKELLIATKNKGKIREIKSLLSDSPITVRNLDEFPEIVEPEETGVTFAENAILKARYYAAQTGVAALADDSGLEVEALNGAPGVLSARYGGENADDAQRISKLLSGIKNVPLSERQARFVCVMAISDANETIVTTQEGICGGNLAFEPVGENGFGYDPIFIPEGFEQTFAELPTEIKQQISHRARAIFKISAFLRGFTAL